MTETQKIKIALVGNPNSGKSSIFNLLTGLRQQVSNFPGVTVEKKTADISLSNNRHYIITDLPGTYSLFPNSTEEKIVVNILTNPSDADHPDLVIYVADVTQLERHLLLATQIADLGLPMIFVLNMMDLADQSGLSVNVEQLNNFLGIKVIPLSGRTQYNLTHLKSAMDRFSHDENSEYIPSKKFYTIHDSLENITESIQQLIPDSKPYNTKILAHHHVWLNCLTTEQRNKIIEILAQHQFKDLPMQVEETMKRFSVIEPLVKKIILDENAKTNTLTDKIDNIITHKYAGPAIFFGIMFLVFQAIFSWASYPMDWIESGFLWLGQVIQVQLPENWITDLLVNGILAGLGGVVIFVPQIAILFFLISLLEESGYMSRAVFMFDTIMQKFGMNGRSIVALISSGACAIPAIMTTRTISNPKERLITILVSPLISCSARIPVYAILVGFVIPSSTVLGIFNAQGLVFMGLYLLGIVAALSVSLVFKSILKSQETSYLMMEMPNYKSPLWKNVVINVKEKVYAFIKEAGKIIILISIVLWFLASYGPDNKMSDAQKNANTQSIELGLSETEAENLSAAYKIEASYAGILGKFIEPAILPLGFDWKIGIALITSFAAREVFIGTMATIYSIGSADDEVTLRERMSVELKPDRKRKMFDMPTSLSLLIFYVFAMQCMSTLAVVKKETGSWKWPIVQFLFMGLLAYCGSLFVYQLLGS